LTISKYQVILIIEIMQTNHRDIKYVMIKRINYFLTGGRKNGED